MEGKQDELFTGPTLQKIEDMMEYAYPVLQQFPKSEKFAMAADMKLVMDVMLEKAVEAQKKYFKKTTLQELDVANRSKTCRCFSKKSNSLRSPNSVRRTLIASERRLRG